jgi:hypothetical protein
MRTILSVLTLVALLASVPAALSQESTPPPLRLNLNQLDISRESPDTVLRESLRGSGGPSPARAEPQWEILPDGTARYGTGPFSVIVSPQCLPPSRAFPNRGLH